MYGVEDIHTKGTINHLSPLPIARIHDKIQYDYGIVLTNRTLKMTCVVLFLFELISPQCRRFKCRGGAISNWGQSIRYGTPQSDRFELRFSMGHFSFDLHGIMSLVASTLAQSIFHIL